MIYRIDVDPAAQDQIRALPDRAVPVLADALAAVAAHPWDSPPIADGNPSGAVRTLPFGGVGLLTYLVLEDQRRVDVLDVLWAGD